MTKETAVYRLYDAEGALLYVGITDNVQQRFHSHAGTKAWWPDVAEKRIEWHPLRSIADGHETVAINAEDPRYNQKKRWAASLGRRRGLGTLEYECKGVGAPDHVAEHLGIPPGELVLRQAELFDLDGYPAILVYKWTRVISPPREVRIFTRGREVEVNRILDTHERWMLSLAFDEHPQHYARVDYSSKGAPVCLWEDMRPEWFSHTASRKLAGGRLDPKSSWYRRRLPAIPPGVDDVPADALVTLGPSRVELRAMGQRPAPGKLPAWYRGSAGADVQDGSATKALPEAPRATPPPMPADAPGAYQALERRVAALEAILRREQVGQLASERQP